MLRWLVLSGLTYGLILLGLGILRGDLVALAFPLALYWLATLIFRPPPPRLAATRHLSAQRVTVGAEVTVRLVIVNQGELLDQAEIDDLLPPNVHVAAGGSKVITSLAPNAQVELSYTLRPAHGFYRFENVAVTASDHLGLTTQTLTFAARAELEVRPRVLRLPRIPIRPRYAAAYAGLIPTRLGGAGLAFFGVREYHPGDSLRHINWHASARHPQTLFSNEFQQERATEVGVILDVRQRSYALLGVEAFFEHAVVTVASLAQTFLNDGNRVGLMLYGRRLVDWTLAGYGRPQHERIVHALTRAQLGETHAFDRLEYLPAHFFVPGSQIVFVSPLLKEDLETLVQLRARGYAVWVVSPDPVAHEARQLGEQAETVRLAARIARLERRLLLQRLQHSGVPVFDWDVSIPLDQALRVFLRNAGRWLGAPL
jgi:uncharacterized protein (DUF58 family)